MANRISIENDYPGIEVSNGLWERGRARIPAGTQTLAKGPQGHVNGVAPKYLARGKDGHVWDVDGNEFIDMTMGVGPLGLGYAYPRVDDAVRRQLESGMTFSLMHPLEVEVAELMGEIIPNAESVRFGKTGAEATSAAIRVARAFTGRDKVMCCGYHGWHDWYIGVTDRHAGVPGAIRDMVWTFQYNDMKTVREVLDTNTAAVILEPVTFDPPKADFLRELRRACDEVGALLIFDEMWTGFRVALGGSQERFDVRADLATFSKAVANGMPLSVLTGRRDVMEYFDEEVFFFSTFGGEALSLAAAVATMAEYRERNVIQALHDKGAALLQGYNSLVERKGLGFTRCKGYEPRTVVVFDAVDGATPLELKSLMQQEMIRMGVLWGGFHNVCYTHTDADIEHTLAAYGKALDIVARAVDDKNVAGALKGPSLQPVFRRIGNFHTKPQQKGA